jgi:hypothetical protein
MTHDPTHDTEGPGLGVRLIGRAERLGLGGLFGCLICDSRGLVGWPRWATLTLGRWRSR